MPKNFNGNNLPKFHADTPSYPSSYDEPIDNNIITICDEQEQVIHVQFEANSDIAVQFGAFIPINTDVPITDVYYGNSAYWDSQPTLVAEIGKLYIYSDWLLDEQGRQIAGFKVGDGESLLKDLPFTGSVFQDHITDTIVHVTQQDRDFWNNKVRCYIDPDCPDQIVFTTN